MVYHILIAEDDKDISEIVTVYLESSGYRVSSASDGEAAYTIFEQEEIDLAILDIMMPRLDGYGLIQRIRQSSSIPIIVLSAKDEDADKILGLNIGADDYITKPFNPLEIIARVNAALRRYHQSGPVKEASSSLQVGALRLDMEKMVLEKDGHPIRLTGMEYKLLQILMMSPGTIFTRQQLYERVSGEYFDSDDTTMMVHISNLREKIERDSKHPDYIKTVRGLGYKFEAPS